MKLLCVLAVASLACGAADLTFGTVRTGVKGKPAPLVWEERGSGLWHVMADGTLTGAREVTQTGPKKRFIAEQKVFNDWVNRQAWVYTKAEYGDSDLEFEYWLRTEGNSGIAVWDISRGEGGIGTAPDYRKTPSKVAYEIQLNNLYPDPNPSGSIYGVEKAKVGAQKDNEWNTIRVEARAAHLKVFINGTLVAEHDTLPDRPTKGPFGLQLHDQFSVMMMRNLRLTLR